MQANGGAGEGAARPTGGGDGEAGRAAGGASAAGWLPSRRAVLAGLVGAAGLRALPAVTDQLLPAPANAAGAVLVTVDPARDVGALPPRAMGFSFEKNTVATPLFSTTNLALIALFRLLGPGVLRIGGNSVDKVTFDASGPGLVPGSVAPADLARLAAFADAVGWQVIYGTPFLFATADQVREEAVAASAALGDRLDAFELCNEPDLYVLDPVAKPIAGSPALFHPRWQAFADAVHAALPDAVLSGPATCFITMAHGFTVPFAAAHAGSFSLLTQHYYRGFGFGAQTIDVLLGPDPALDAGLAELRAAATARGLTYRLAETNSFANGGQPGVSNTFASALWGAGLYTEAGANGAAGVNFHNSGSGPGYPAIVNVGGVVTQIRPLYYGLLLAADAGTGPMPDVAVQGADPTLSVHAVRPAPTDLRVVLLNTGATAVDVIIDAGQPVTQASATRLLGPALGATDGVTYAGAEVALDGSFARQPPEPLAVGGAQLTVSLPPASGALVRLTLAAPPPTTTTSTTVTTSTSTSTTSTTVADPSAPGTTGAATAAVAGAPAAPPARPVPGAPTFSG